MLPKGMRPILPRDHSVFLIVCVELHQRAESFELPGLLARVLTYQDLAE